MDVGSILPLIISAGVVVLLLAGVLWLRARRALVRRIVAVAARLDEHPVAMDGRGGREAALDRLESEADRIYRRSVARLFSGDFNAFDVLRWKDIVEAIEESINGLEKISDVVEGIALKHS